MKNSKIIFMVVLLSASLMASNVSAKRLLSSSNGQNCKMVETASLSVSFNNVSVELKNTKSYIEEKADEILLIAKDLEIEEIHINNMNYNVYTNNNGGCNASTPSKYNMNGSFSFKIDDAEKAATLVGAIGAKGYQVNFSMNGYRQCQ